MYLVWQIVVKTDRKNKQFTTRNTPIKNAVQNLTFKNSSKSSQEKRFSKPNCLQRVDYLSKSRTPPNSFSSTQYSHKLTIKRNVANRFFIDRKKATTYEHFTVHSIIILFYCSNLNNSACDNNIKTTSYGVWSLTDRISSEDALFRPGTELESRTSQLTDDIHTCSFFGNQRLKLRFVGFCAPACRQPCIHECVCVGRCGTTASEGSNYNYRMTIDDYLGGWWWWIVT